MVLGILRTSSFFTDLVMRIRGILRTTFRRLKPLFLGVFAVSDGVLGIIVSDDSKDFSAPDCKQNFWTFF